MIEEIIGAALIVASALLTQRRMERVFTSRLQDQDKLEADRRAALYKQQKATARAVAQSDRAVRRMVDQSRVTQEDTKRLQRQADALLGHPALKRIIAREEERRG